jgi:hypothetical protein
MTAHTTGMNHLKSDYMTYRTVAAHQASEVWFHLYIRSTR